MDFVIDCSVVCSFLMNDEDNSYADKVLDMLQNKKAVAPSIILYEITNVLYVANKRQRCSVKETEDLMDLTNKLSIEIHQLDNVLQMKEILSISLKHKISSYDASYLYLSKKLNLPLATLDKQLIKIASSENLFFA